MYMDEQRRGMEEVLMPLICPICRCDIYTNFYHKEHNDLIICKVCRHVYWREIPSEELLSTYYSLKYAPEHNQIELQKSNISYYQAHMQELVVMSKNSPENSSILDYGSSHPFLLIEAKSMGFSNVIGVEWDEEASKYGVTNGINMINPNELSQSIKDNSLDIVRFSHVLEHLIDPVIIMESINKKLKKGGLIYITQPNFPVFAFEESKRDLLDSVWPEHLHFFSPISLVKLVEGSGYNIIKYFTHQNTAQSLERYSENIDILYAIDKIKNQRETGDLFFGRNANYPVYSGENSVMFAVKK
jgi:2-polyprenyl-3-methyl-5-hydroxy-6-metoxy-1,4-benzoquinol methylase